MIIETTIEVVNRKYQELTGEEQVMYVKMSFNTDDVSAVREVIDDEEYEVNPARCQIYLKSGEYFTIDTPYTTVVEELKYKPQKSYPL